MTGRIWIRRGVGWPTRYGLAHTRDPNAMSLMGWRAYCGTWLPSKPDHLWSQAVPEDRKCRECERGADAATTEESS